MYPDKNQLVKVYTRQNGPYWISGVYGLTQARGQATKHRTWAYRNVSHTEIWEIVGDKLNLISLDYTGVKVV